MRKRFEQYWVLEPACDAGTPVDAEDLDPLVRDKIVALAGDDRGPLAVYLPFLNRREFRRRADYLADLEFVRDGNTIRFVTPPWSSDLREHAALLVGLHPAWKNAPALYDRAHFSRWQRVSMAVQMAMRRWAPQIYFRDLNRYEDRNRAYSMIVYEASRPCPGRPRTEFTYDRADAQMLPMAFDSIGAATEQVLRRAERRLNEAGRGELARRYAPAWRRDILHTVQRRPRLLVELLGDEAGLVNAIINLGTARSLTAVRPFTRAADAALRNLHGEDMRELTVRALEVATKALAEGAARAAAKRPISQSARATPRQPFWEPGTSGRCRPGSAASP